MKLCKAGLSGLLSVSLVCSCLLFGCRPKETIEEPAPASTIDIGVIIPTEGTLWLYGRECLKGLSLAVEECNQSGGVKGQDVSLRIENNEGNPLMSAEAVKRLASDSTVLAVIGPITSNNSLAAATVAEYEGIPLLLPYSTVPSVTEVGEFISRICFTNVFQARAIARYSFASLGIKRAAILYEKDNAYSEGLALFFEREFSALGGDICSKESFSKRDASYLPFLQRMFLKSPQAIFLPGYYPQAAQLIRDVVVMEEEITFLGGDGWESLEKTELPIEVLDDAFPILITSHFSPEDVRATTQHFVQLYVEKYGSAPNALSALAYDAGMLLINALGRTNQMKREALKDAINSTRDFSGATGNITLNEKRNAIKPAYLLEMRGGRFHLRASDVPMW